jgi:hypothetical protein
MFTCWRESSKFFRVDREAVRRVFANRPQQQCKREHEGHEKPCRGVEFECENNHADRNQQCRNRCWPSTCLPVRKLDCRDH